MSENPVNKFSKAQEDRRKSFIVENDYVADDVLSNQSPSNTVTPSGGLRSIIDKKKETKARISITIDAETDEFYMRLGRIVDVSKSKLMGEILAYAINENPDIQEMAKTNKRVQKILDEFNEGFY